MSHANAALTPRARLKVAQLVVDEGWPISEVAARFQVSWPTVKRWADRYAAGEPMADGRAGPATSPAGLHNRWCEGCWSCGGVSVWARCSSLPGAVLRRRRCTRSWFGTG